MKVIRHGQELKTLIFMLYGSHNNKEMVKKKQSDHGNRKKNKDTKWTNSVMWWSVYE